MRKLLHGCPAQIRQAARHRGVHGREGGPVLRIVLVMGQISQDLGRQEKTMFTNTHTSGELARQRQRDILARAGRRLRLAVRTVIRAVRMAHYEQVRMWECVLLTSGAAPLTTAGPLRWVPSLGGYRLAGSHPLAQDPSETGR
jgi:hypothetical protein